MARWAKTWVRAARLAAAALSLVLGLAGCGGSPPGAPEPPAVKPGGDAPRDAAPEASTPSTSAAPAAPEPARDALHQSFIQATRRADDPPAGADRPPDRTISGKAVFKLLDEVQKNWDSIRFVADGKKLDYTAVIDTDFGVVEIALLPEVAPNHVRNFVALARAGYYDGLRFDGVIQEKAPDDAGGVTALEQVWAGCPLGTGETYSGGIGYWLKPEFNAKARGVTHSEGTVGAVRLAEPDTAATRFYINLTPAPYLDESYTIFGKVVKGLDVVRTITVQPKVPEEEGKYRPEKPIVIKSVTIQTRVGGPVNGAEGKR